MQTCAQFFFDDSFFVDKKSFTDIQNFFDDSFFVDKKSLRDVSNLKLWRFTGEKGVGVGVGERSECLKPARPFAPDQEEHFQSVSKRERAS